VVVVGFMWLVVAVANGPLLSHHNVIYYCISKTTSQKTGWEERLRHDLFCVERDVKP